MFEYDQHIPLDLDQSTPEPANVKVYGLSYASPRGGRVPAYLVVPDGEGPFAGMLFMHPGGAGRGYFLDEAIGFAQAGAVALLIDAPNVRPPRRPLFSFSEQDRDGFIQAVVDLRRGVDVLTARPDVDPDRLGYIGFSYGATVGAMLAGVEKRIKAYAIIGGAARLTYFLRWISEDESLPREQLEQWLHSMAVLDSIQYVSHAAPSAIFFQNGRHDQNVPQEEAAALHAAGSEPKLIKWYDAGHDLNAEARRDRAAWLHQQIGIDPRLHLY